MDITQKNNVHNGSCAADEGSHMSSLDQKERGIREVLWGSHQWMVLAELSHYSPEAK